MSGMDRRGFLVGAVGAAAGASLANARGDESQASPGRREYYELRILRLSRGPALKRIENYFEKALIPACRRLGTGPVGVFSLMIGPDSPSYYVLIPHPSAESACTLADRLGEDAGYRAAASAMREATAADPPYLNQESRLLMAADFMPKLEGAGETHTRNSRIFELRTYRSPSKTAARKKLEMFGSGGELAIFRRTGLEPVFFAETLFGPHMPSLCYMIRFPDLASREKKWAAFGGDAEWKKLSTTPGFTDAEIVADIHNVILRPASYSQI